MWADAIIPITMKVRALQLDGSQLDIWDLDADRIRIGVQLALNLQTCSGSGVGDEVDDDLVALQRSAAPVLRDLREKPVLDLIPLAGARREVADADVQAGVVGQFLQLNLPQAGPWIVATSAIGGDQQFRAIIPTFPSPRS